MPMTFGSLFAGIGGFDLGLERAGMECKWQVEIDDFCNRVLEKHWPHVKRYRDVREVGKHNLEPVDLICGGFPCQPFSSASHGRRRGIFDERFLWPEMFRVVSDIRPTWVIGENVARIDRVAIKQVRSNMESIGYQVAILSIPACAVDKDHIRERKWFLCHADENSKSIGPFYEETSRMPRDNTDSGNIRKQDGIPDRMDRIRSLGNAVVPQVVQILGEAIMEVEKKHGNL